MIHSVDPSGRLYLPWTLESVMPWRLGVGYGAFALLVLLLGLKKTPEAAHA